MNNENKYQFINNLPKEYNRIFWDIMISAESDKELGVRFNKSECKLIMRYLYKKDKEIERLNNIINEYRVMNAKRRSLINATYGYNIDLERKYYDIVTNDYINLFECIANFISYNSYLNELLGENIIKDFNKLYLELSTRRIEIIKEN